MLVNKSSLYKRCKRNFETKVRPILVQLYRSRHQLWTLANGSVNSEPFFFDKIHLAQKRNSNLSKSIPQRIEDFYDTGDINHYQLTKSYKLAVSYVLSNAEFPSLSTLSKLHSTFINALFDKYFFNTANLTLFLGLFLLYLKTLLLRINLFADFYVTHHYTLNLFQLKDILLIIFYLKISFQVIPFLFDYQIMLMFTCACS